MSQILTPINYKIVEIKEAEVACLFNWSKVYQSMLPQCSYKDWFSQILPQHSMSVGDFWQF